MLTSTLLTTDGPGGIKAGSKAEALKALEEVLNEWDRKFMEVY